MEKFNIQLNLYPQCLLYEIRDEVYCEIKESISTIQDECPGIELSEDDFTFDEDEYETACAQNFVNEYANMAPSFVKSINNYNINKPREYRCFGRGDYLYADVELSDDWLDIMLQWIDDNIDWFEERIVEEWTSRDGFWSFMSTSVDTWKEKLKEKDELYIGEIIFYMMYLKEDDNLLENLNYAICEEYVGSYIHLNDEKNAEVEAAASDNK